MVELVKALVGLVCGTISQCDVNHSRTNLTLWVFFNFLLGYVNILEVALELQFNNMLQLQNIVLVQINGRKIWEFFL